MSDKTVTVRTPGFGFFGALALLLAAAKLFAEYQVSWGIIVAVALAPLAITLVVLAAFAVIAAAAFVFGGLLLLGAEVVDWVAAKRRKNGR